jgi:hypothetical protein
LVSRTPYLVENYEQLLVEVNHVPLSKHVRYNATRFIPYSHSQIMSFLTLISVSTVDLWVGVIRCGKASGNSSKFVI